MTGLDLKLNVNQKIEVLQDGVAYKSKVQDTNENYILIDIPLSGNRYFITHPGSTIEFFVPTEKDVTKCRSIILGKRRENNVEMIVLSLPEVIEKVQRREYFRLPITMEIKYSLLPEDKRYFDLRDVPPTYYKQMNKGLSVDISGGGIKIISKEKTTPGANVLLLVPLPQEVMILASVIRIEELDNKTFRLALRFDNIDEKTRDNIIRFIFSKMREQLKLLK
ncbi:Flagellar brake protein YcgR [Caloramator mitchellensis]|uniref:Flagellar brake protein YcgR n=1 Tax=Caloramator mitchellensis TaxID=908809 RepID=A0A0R3JU21_CALMK|nr:flagellar brake domain-containing protein [Caloramator mitchellensis]KRQ87040.1 Flagellar brake protein YcgR [Caloramator mitchellensis]